MCVPMKNSRITEDLEHRISFVKWLFEREKQYKNIVFLFRSKKNPGNFRITSLYENCKDTRQVIVSGLCWSKLDLAIIRLLPLLVRLSKFKIEKYRWLNVPASSGFKGINVNQIVHLDDPTYSKGEIDSIVRWENALNRRKRDTIIVSTCIEAVDWLKESGVQSKLEILPQGFTKYPFPVKKNSEFTCIYTSAYIHFGSDKHASHSTWGSQVLFEIINKFDELGENVNFVLVGNLGQDAKSIASSFRKVSTTDYLEPKDQARLLKSAHVGLYPRTNDHRRRVLKIYEYAGAGLPVVAFDLVDSIDVKTHDFGINVNSIEEFVESILILKNNKDLYDAKSRNALQFSFRKDWESLATKLERLQY